MATPYLGEIKMFGGNFAPQNWAFCNGQILSINQNQALFSLLGTTYGGNGTQTFALPNLQCCVPMHQGQGSGLSNYVIGQTVGAPSTTLTTSNLPVHSHTLKASSAAGTARVPTNALVLADVGRNQAIYETGSSAVSFGPGSIGNTGSSVPISHLQPYLALSFIIALAGIFPSRN
jgi:microcystin-dependent protein